jgi:membrane fusion protein (multidrug efflux system)
MSALAREAAGVIHHLVVQHLTRAQELAQDKAGLYRPEALEQHRKRGHEGVVTELSPRWVRSAYPMLCITMAAALAFGYFVKIPTYSTGTGIVELPGTPVSASAMGTVEKVYVQPNDHVKTGDKLVKLSSSNEDAALEQARTNQANILQQYLFDQNDEQVKKQLVTVRSELKRLQRAADDRTIRATKDGVVADIQAVPSHSVQLGEHMATIVDEGTIPEMHAFLPGTDRARIHTGMTLQVDLIGYTKSREYAQITYVSPDVLATAAANQTVGPEYAESLHLPQQGSWIEIRAKLPATTFRSKGRTMFYHQGMPAKTEVRIEAKRFLVTLLPSLDKYMP